MATAIHEGFVDNHIKQVVSDEMKNHTNTYPTMHGQLPPGVALPYIRQGQTAYPEGWGLCNPSLDKLFLVGTTSLDQVGDRVGSPKHVHPVSIQTNYGEGKEMAAPEAADNYADGGSNRPHKHWVAGNTDDVDNLPPAVKVVFLCMIVASS